MKLMSTIIYLNSANNITERSGFTQYAKIGRLQSLSILLVTNGYPKFISPRS